MQLARRIPETRLVRILIVLAGIVAGQFALYGPSLVGNKILLPLDILAYSESYIPQNPDSPAPYPHNLQYVDLVFQAEPTRLYLGSELRSGRFPLWNPLEFAGVPDITPKYSPFFLLAALVASPKILPWVAMLKAIVAGLGAYCFCRGALKLSFWPAAIAGWCYPITAFFVLWQTFYASIPVLWLPWLLWAVNRTVRRSNPGAMVALSLLTALVLVSGQLDVAGQVLLTSGFYSLWCLADAWRRRRWLAVRVARAAALLAVGWCLGFLLAAPYILPLLEYAQTGARTTHRSSGTEERPPVGLPALPQIVMPNMYGSTESGGFPLYPKGEGNLAESSSAAYTGVLAALFAAPLAWCSRRHRSLNFFWLALGIFALGWCLNIWPLVAFLRLPGLNLMSHNRFVFATSFCILALAATGLDALWRGRVHWQRWFLLPIAILVFLAGWGVMRTMVLPDPIETQLPAEVIGGRTLGWLHDLQGVKEAQSWYTRMYAVGALQCALALVAWGFLIYRKTSRRKMFPMIAVVMVADLLWLGCGRATQAPPEQYYPRIPALEQVAKAEPGRIIGYNCLPALLGFTQHLSDIRGYDAVDPARLMDILMLAADSTSTKYAYAMVQLMTPQTLSKVYENLRLPPILNMLGVRYMILRGTPPSGAHPDFQSPDYWVMVNHGALPRVFVPHRVETIADDKARLEKMGSADFDAREIAYVESPVALSGLCFGAAQITGESATKITVSAQMQTPGLIVLADLWNKGWRAYLNGQPEPILRTNHAIRGVVVPAGKSTLEFRYEPASFALGLKLAGLAAVLLVGCWGYDTAVKARTKKVHAS